MSCDNQKQGLASNLIQLLCGLLFLVIPLAEGMIHQSENLDFFSSLFTLDEGKTYV